MNITKTTTDAPLSKADATALILAAKAAHGLTWEAIAEGIGMSPVWTTSAALGMNSMPPEKAQALVALLDLPAAVVPALVAFPTKVWDQAVPTDPAIYRLYEIVGVYGETLKEIIQEKFGDGIMSAIDFTMHVDKVEDPKGDRVKITMNGKFLPYKAW
ncbi:cyanase [Tistrella mobilis]|uniref:cyanase n=1 Tax=Tistrella mobilis TaxID=171437 RepID=UPI00355843AE